jgi:feruloyl esterase
MSVIRAVTIEVAAAKVLRRLAAVAGTGALLVVLTAPARAEATTCSTAALAALAVPGVSITSASPVAATSTAPAYCDVLGSVATDGEGAGPNVADFDVKLPDAWNHKFMFMGVGGLAGSLNPSINAVDRGLSLVKGYATAVTTTGHVTATDPLWMLGSPGVNTNKVIDYYYRAAHQVGIAAKLLVKAYYGTSTIARSYFDGCSNGGKMGLLEAMRYPEDYDGIVAGAPWLDPLGTSLWGLKNVKALLAAYVPPTLFPAIEAAVNASCDAVDGVADGLIQDPARCSFDPQSLVPATLSQAQADALKLILEPVRDDRGRLVYPGSSVSNLGQTGSAGWGLAANELLTTPPLDPTAALPWGPGVNGPSNWSLATGIIRNLGYYDTGFDLNNGVEHAGVMSSDARDLLYGRLAQDIPSNPARLTAFFKRGGKLLIYHGYSDPIISPYRTTWFYDELAEGRGGYGNLQDDARLFMVPGMQHCSGGSFPNTFDTLTAIEQWVENGVPPEAIAASHTTGTAVDRTMPLCKYPEQARWNGHGSVLDASSWSCPAHDSTLLKTGPNGIQAAARGRDDDDRDESRRR